MPSPTTFRDFEHAGWRDASVCRHYDSHFGAITTQSVAALLDAARVGPGCRVLDVCTGAGYAAGAAAGRGAVATGLDFSVSQVELARERYPGASFRHGDATALPFADGEFDAVVNAIGMPHFEDPDAALREAHRVLGPGGRHAFTVYDAPSRAVGFGVLYAAVQAHGTLDIGLPAGPNFFLFSDPAEATTRLEAAGFVEASVTTVPQTWDLESVDAYFAAIEQGSVRASATLRGQTPDALEEIRAAVAEALTSYRVGAGYAVPMPAVLVAATRP